MQSSNKTVDTRIENGRLLTRNGITQQKMGVAIENGSIVSTGKETILPGARTVIDTEGGLIAPGLVDEHVHDRSIGQTHKEDWATLTRAAARGGVTTVLGHGNTNPYIDSAENVTRKLTRGERDGIIDFGCFAWVTPSNYDNLEPLLQSDAIGLQASLDEQALSAGELLTAMKQISAAEQRLGIHVEHGSVITERKEQIQRSDSVELLDHCRSRPVIAEKIGADTIVALARETGCAVHVFQISSGTGLDRLTHARQSGLDITIETTPHYCWFSDEEMKKQGSIAVVSPPLRSESERQHLLAGLADGQIDCLGTDHAPHTDKENFINRSVDSVWDVAPGFVGVETAHAAALQWVKEGHLSLSQWIKLHSCTPAQVWGLYPQKGSLQPGTDADIVVIDPDEKWTIDRHELGSKSTATIWDGETVTGKVMKTLVRGEVVYDDGSLCVEPGYGKPLKNNR